MMYKIRFHVAARKEWHKLGVTLQLQLQKKLDKVRYQPHIPKAKLSDMPNCYKIKLKKSGYRLVYRVEEETVFIQIIAIGRRDGAVYSDASERLH